MPINIRAHFLLWCLLLVIVTSACQPTDTATPVAQVIPTPTTEPATIPIAATPTTATAVPIADTIALAPFTIHLPATWPMLHAGDAGWNAQLQQIQRTHPHLEHYLQKLLPAALAGTTVIVAWNPSPPASTIVMAAITPANGLTLQGYLSAITEELEQSRLMVGSAVTIHQAQMRYDLHQANIPLAFVHYTLTPKTKEPKIAGYQAAMLDSQTDQLLLLTIITPDSAAEESQAIITSILRTIAVK